MNKAAARNMWSQFIKLTTRGHASELLRNPALDFTTAAKSGVFDHISDEDYAPLLLGCNQMSYAIWHDAPQRTAGALLLTALAATKIPDEKVDIIADLLAASSECTEYPTADLLDEWEAMPADEQDTQHIAGTTMGSLSPKEIEREIRSCGIIGQDAAVKAASLIFYNHTQGRPSVSLFAGATGCGKTEIWRAIQRKHPECIVIQDASTLTAEGWKGGNKISTIFRTIPPNNRGKVLLILDEFDKLLEPQFGANGTNHSDVLQNQLLKLFDHDVLFIGSEEGVQKGFAVDASGISIVLLGAFQRVMQKKSRDTGSMGFGNDLRQNLDYGNTKLTIEDLVACGMRAELAGRINRITCMDPLSVDDLTRIGRGEVKRLAERVRRPVSIDTGTLKTLANEAKQKGLGARFLRSKLQLMLDDKIYDDPDALTYRLDSSAARTEELQAPASCVA